jgi:hypothetical protein
LWRNARFECFVKNPHVEASRDEIIATFIMSTNDDSGDIRRLMIDGYCGMDKLHRKSWADSNTLSTTPKNTKSEIRNQKSAIITDAELITTTNLIGERMNIKSIVEGCLGKKFGSIFTRITKTLIALPPMRITF